MRRILCASAFALILAPVLAIAAEFPLTAENTKITFLGTKPNGKHNGGFKTVTGKATVDNNDPATLKLTLDIDTKSLYSDNDKLTTHLKSPDFFGVEANPKAKFESTKVEKTDDGYKVTGDLTMLGKTKSVSFPAKMSVGDKGLNLESSFTIDRTQWGMTFGAGKIDNDVKLTVKLKAK